LQKKTLEEYEQLENTRIKEVIDKTNSLTTKVILFKQGVLVLNNTWINVNVDSKALKIQLLINNNFIKYKLKFVTILGVLAIL
jgi:hypothetical protein